MTQVIPSSGSAAEAVSDVLLVGAFSTSKGFELSGVAGELDGPLDGYLSEYLQEISYGAKAGEIALVATGRKLPSKAVAVIGLGDKSKVGTAEMRRAAGAAARRIDRPVLATTMSDGFDESFDRAAIEGLLLGSYRFEGQKTDPRRPKLQQILALGASEDSVERATIAAEVTILARDLVNEPASVLTPEVFATRAQEVADANNISCEIWDETRLEKENFGGLLGVASGSDHPPRLIILRYSPTGASASYALVGKGVTYDSGGLSIKPAKSMEEMKTDMAGGAAVLGAMVAASRLGLPFDILGVIPATENMLGGAALKPGDVLRQRSGKTTEVLNTDAEGRLILADALAYASEAKPQAIIDVATLTGAMHVALGNRISGYFANDDNLAQEVEAAADAAGERFWRMPLTDNYRKDLDSDVADMKNIASRYGGAIYAALFLRDHVGKGIAWAHLDIAGPARADSDYEEMPRGGTGVGTRTLLAWLEAREAAS
jgi:leucyl aminopeptidase